MYQSDHLLLPNTIPRANGERLYDLELIVLPAIRFLCRVHPSLGRKQIRLVEI